MPPLPPKPRIPGSQVAPGQRPLYRDAPTASTHSKLPISQATAGKTYRVRCKDWVTVHGEGLTWEAANKLKDQRASEGFRTARVEDEAISPPEWYEAAPAPVNNRWDEVLDPTPDLDHLDPELEALRRGAFHAARSAATAANARVAEGGAAARAEQLARMTGARPVVVTIPVAPPTPPVAPAPPPPPPAAAAKFVAPAPPRRPAHPPNPNRVVPRDRTVQAAPFRRTEPPPRDRTAASEVLKRAHAPAAEPPRPLISPLKAAMMADDPLDIPDGAVGDDDLSDLVSDLGGGASDKDVEQAKAQADVERRARG
jgi:hypothetical protein